MAGKIVNTQNLDYVNERLRKSLHVEVWRERGVINWPLTRDTEEEMEPKYNNLFERKNREILSGLVVRGLLPSWLRW